MSNYFHSFILSFNLNLESNERLLSRKRKTFDSNDPKGVAIQRFSLVRWKMRSVENEECGKCGVWKVRSVENAECGKCGVWKM